MTVLFDVTPIPHSFESVLCLVINISIVCCVHIDLWQNKTEAYYCHSHLARSQQPHVTG